MRKVIFTTGVCLGLCLLPGTSFAKPLPAPYRLSPAQQKEILREARARRRIGKDKTAGLRLSKNTFLRVEIGSDALRQNEGTQGQVKYGVKF